MEELDEPLWSIPRLFGAFCLYIHFILGGVHKTPFLVMMKYHRRRYAQYMETI